MIDGQNLYSMNYHTSIEQSAIRCSFFHRRRERKGEILGVKKSLTVNV